MQYFCFCVSGCVTERESNRGYEGRAEKDCISCAFAGVLDILSQQKSAL